MWYNSEMTPKLTDEQRQAIALQGGKPVQVVDPTSSHVFYLISSEQFAALRSLLKPDDFDVRATYPAQQQAVGAIWDDPALDIYNEPVDSPGSL